jgi:hypothetical protein
MDTHEGREMILSGDSNMAKDWSFANLSLNLKEQISAGAFTGPGPGRSTGLALGWIPYMRIDLV